MEECRLPIELCEMIIDAVGAPLVDEQDAHGLVWLGHSTQCRGQQDTLRACTLACRAWSTRSRRLLSTHICFYHPKSSRNLSQTTCCSPSSTMTSLHIDGEDWEEAECVKLRGLFLKPGFPSLRALALENMDLTGVSCLDPRILRAHLPFFTNISTLALYKCYFPSVSGLLRLVWACPNLSSLAMCHCWKFWGSACKDEAAAQLSLARTRRQGCAKLTSLSLAFDVDVRMMCCIHVVPAPDPCVCSSRAITRSSTPHRACLVPH